VHQGVQVIADVVPMQQWWHLEHAIKMTRDTVPNAPGPQHLRHEFTHPDATYYVALENGGVKAVAGYKRTGVNQAIFEFPWCVVHPDWQRQGLCRRLTERRIQAVKDLGGKAIILTTSKPEVYERFGFLTRAVIPNVWANFFMMLLL
jgi:GNAT superfamily N-acetyltransferase